MKIKRIYIIIVVFFRLLHDVSIKDSGEVNDITRKGDFPARFLK